MILPEMRSLQPPDSHALTAAVGWLELGNPTEAEAELSEIAKSWQDHPDVLEVRWILHAEKKEWDEALQIAESLVGSAPKRPTGWLHRAYALRRAHNGGLRKAWNALLPTARKFPKEPVIPYNLACYACKLQDLNEARRWLATAFKVGDKDAIKKMALADEDLKSMWAQIKTM